jgi:hypothetical protein
MTVTHGSAKWQGGIKDGKGAISTKSGALTDYPYGFASRFEGKPGSNPEELIGDQGRRHAGESRRRLCHYRGSSDADRQDPRR